MNLEKKILNQKILNWHKANEIEERNLKDPIVLKNDAGEIRESDVRKIQKTIFEKPRYGSYSKLPGLGHS